MATRVKRKKPRAVQVDRKQVIVSQWLETLGDDHPRGAATWTVTEDELIALVGVAQGEIIETDPDIGLANLVIRALDHIRLGVDWTDETRESSLEDVVADMREKFGS